MGRPPTTNFGWTIPQSAPKSPLVANPTYKMKTTLFQIVLYILKHYIEKQEDRERQRIVDKKVSNVLAALHRPRFQGLSSKSLSADLARFQTIIVLFND